MGGTELGSRKLVCNILHGGQWIVQSLTVATFWALEILCQLERRQHRLHSRHYYSRPADASHYRKVPHQYEIRHHSSEAGPKQSQADVLGGH